MAFHVILSLSRIKIKPFFVCLRIWNTKIGNDASSSRRDFLTYCLSLMRSHNSEHRDSLPVLDITALRHVAYVLDAIVFYMRSGNDLELEKPDSNLWDDQVREKKVFYLIENRLKWNGIFRMKMIMKIQKMSRRLVLQWIQMKKTMICHGLHWGRDTHFSR